MLKAGKITAAVLPEPFASQAELSLGVTPLADLDQGATAAFPVQGCAVTRQWAAVHPATLAAFRAAFEQGQQIADTNRSAVEQAMEALPSPLGLSQVQAAIMSLDSYPVGAVDVTRLQRVADVMHQYLRFPTFNVRQMTGALRPRAAGQEPFEEQAEVDKRDPHGRVAAAVRQHDGSAVPQGAAGIHDVRDVALALGLLGHQDRLRQRRDQALGLIQVEQGRADGVLPHGSDAVGEDQPSRRGLDRRAAVAELDQFPRTGRRLDGAGLRPVMSVV